MRFEPVFTKSRYINSVIWTEYNWDFFNEYYPTPSMMFLKYAGKSPLNFENIPL